MYREIFESALLPLQDGIYFDIKLKKDYVSGSSLCQRIDDKILNSLKLINNKNIKEFLGTIDDEFSDTLIISYKGIMFSLYVSDGVLSVGGNGQLSSCSDIKKLDFDNIAKEIKTMKIR